ncbi:MAG TPA: signal peptide peptidase SppA [Stellaceae bacterium]|nr:signal peptide peptidase SppA [Stellaceae bacterium]
MWRVTVRIFAVIGGLSVLGFLGFVGLVAVIASYVPVRPPLPGSIVLSVDLDQDLAEGPNPDTVSRVLFGTQPTLRDFLDALERAGNDPRVKGIYVRLGDDKLGLARTQEVRDAIAAFRAKGKFAIAFSDTFGEFGPGTRPYYLATAFGDIWLQPMGDVGLTGLYSETPFLHDALAKLGITASFSKREEYKTVMNSLTESAMTAPQREETDGLLTSLDGQIVHGIAAARKIDDTTLRGLIDRAPLFADEAKAAGLVDHLGYRDQAVQAALRRAGNGAQFVTLTRYLNEAGRPHQSGTKVALIYGDGLITREGTGGGLIGESGLDAGKVAKAFRDAIADKKVHAILFRIDSPGGSVVASETVWREVERAHRLGKPVVVSMGDVAASGGYYIAAPADKIVAEPATLTGSIGVVAGKLVLSGLMQKIGVSVGVVERGANAGIFSAAQNFSPDMQHRLDDILDRTYRGFKDRVAAGRHLSPDAVEGVAKGRVWTGQQAKANGLVDALGGYSVALGLVRQVAKLPANAPIHLVVFPQRKNPIRELVDRLEGKRDTVPGATAAIGARLGAALALVDRIAALIAAPGTVQMPPIDPR